MLDHEGKEVPGNRGYKYEMFELYCINIGRHKPVWTDLWLVDYNNETQ